MKDIDGFPCGDKTDVLEKKATRAIYDAVLRALEDTKKVYQDPRIAFQEGLNTAREILSKVSRGTRKQVEKDLIKPYIQRNSFD